MVEDKKQAPKEDNYKHIVRIANVDIPGAKPIGVGLTKIKGVGKNLSTIFCNVLNINKTKKTGNLNDSEIEKLNEAVQSPLSHNVPVWLLNRRKDYETGEDRHILTGTLNFVKENDLKRLKKIKTLRGARHQRGLPVRGQRTRSNFRKSKGKVVGVKKKGAKGGK